MISVDEEDEFIDVEYAAVETLTNVSSLHEETGRY